MKSIILSLTAFFSLVSISSFSSVEHRELQRVREYNKKLRAQCEETFHMNITCPMNGQVEVPTYFIKEICEKRDNVERCALNFMRHLSNSYNCHKRPEVPQAVWDTKKRERSSYCVNRVENISDEFYVSDAFDKCSSNALGTDEDCFIQEVLK